MFLQVGNTCEMPAYVQREEFTDPMYSNGFDRESFRWSTPAL
jgi:hypothetical protein